MNANKLADDLDNANGFQYVAQLGLASQAATVLRQQQDEITVLKQILSYEGIEVNLNECVEELRKAQK